jgi:hypothetical protein
VENPTPTDRPVLGLGLVTVAVAALLAVGLHNAAIPVAVIGLLAVSTRIIAGKEDVRHAADVLGVPVLVGLFGVAVALGTLGRVVGAGDIDVASRPLGYGRRRSGLVGGTGTTSRTASSKKSARVIYSVFPMTDIWRRRVHWP